jgi:prepilin-type N-terminal cleavage/methylation domain-containing protein
LALALVERLAFTLIELLVVIAIIAILVGLTAAAVMGFLKKGPELDNMNSIRQLQMACETFKQKYNIYPPSKIYLANNRVLYSQTNPLHVQSLSYLQQIWPRLNWNDPKSPIKWEGANGSKLPVTLEGEQCLVFFLGGIQDGTGCRGFSTNPTNPTELPTVNPKRLGPYFEQFNGTRLKIPTTGQNRFYSYLDTYLKQPYAYFSSGKSANGYVDTDCASLNVTPYKDANGPPPSYYNPNTIQIISAGANGKFGPGGLLAHGGVVGGDGGDDMTNFSDRTLAAGTP